MKITCICQSLVGLVSNWASIRTSPLPRPVLSRYRVEQLRLLDRRLALRAHHRNLTIWRAGASTTKILQAHCLLMCAPTVHQHTRNRSKSLVFRFFASKRGGLKMLRHRKGPGQLPARVTRPWWHCPCLQTRTAPRPSESRLTRPPRGDRNLRRRWRCTRKNQCPIAVWTRPWMRREGARACTGGTWGVGSRLEGLGRGIIEG